MLFFLLLLFFFFLIFFAGKGAHVEGTFKLYGNSQLKVLVGGQPRGANANGGGGGTFVTLDDSAPLLIAGGGGGVGALPLQTAAGRAGPDGGLAGNKGELEKECFNTVLSCF